MKKQLLVSVLFAGSVIGLPAQAEIDATVDIANLYLFRGINMSNGSPMIAGALNYQHQSGLYAGIWSTSGDDKAGVEVNYYLGYSGQLRDLGYQVQYLNYYYPTSKGSAAATVDIEDYAEISLALDFQGVDFSVTAPTQDDAVGKYFYYTLGYGYKAFSATLGLQDHKDKANDYSHLDLKYQFNQHISFVASQILDTGAGSTLNDATLWQVYYQLPISF